MRWRTLIPVSLVVAITIGLAVSGPRSVAQEPPTPHEACEMVFGPPCETICLRECSNGSCCHTRHYNYPIPDDEGPDYEGGN